MRVSGLRAAAAGRVAVEVDGKRWRTVPEEVVARAGLWNGIELDRPLLRTLRRELRRHRALAAATRALRTRALTERRLDERLQRLGFVAWERAETLRVLRRAGFLDDERFAIGRAELLAGRHAGNALIRHDLREQGIDDHTCERALATVEPESRRAVRAAAARGGGSRTARYLARRGFEQEAIEAALGTDAIADGP